MQKLRTWSRRPAGELGGLAWSPMVWIFLALFALAEVGNWRIGKDIARVCELLDQANLDWPSPSPARVQIDDICRNRAPKAFYKAR